MMAVHLYLAMVPDYLPQCEHKTTIRYLQAAQNHKLSVMQSAP
jgi:hypothetical protein